MTSVITTSELLGKTVNVYGSIDEPLFLASDVAEWIDHTSVTMMLKSVDEEEKLTSIIFRAGQNREVNMLTENGLYEVLMLSRKPIAKQFKAGVKSILKSVRKNGGYIANQESLTPEQIVANALIVATNIIDNMKTELKAKDEQLQLQQPKVEYHDEVLSSKGCYNTTQIAKELGTNAQALNKMLNARKIIYKTRDQWVLYSKYENKGYTNTYTVTFGSNKSKQITQWTEEGRKFLHDLFKK